MTGILIQAHPLFAGIDLAALVSGGARLTPRIVPRGALICGPQFRPGIVLVLRGCLQAFNLTADGRQRLIVEMLGPGDIDGMLLAAGRTAHMCEALAPSEVVLLSKADLDRLITLSPRVALNLYAIATGRLERREAHMAALSEHSGLRAVARQLLALAGYTGRNEGSGIVVLHPRPTHQLLAEMLGLRRETVTLMLRRLRNLGAVGYGPREMWVNFRRIERLLERSELLEEPKEDIARIA